MLRAASVPDDILIAVASANAIPLRRLLYLRLLGAYGFVTLILFERYMLALKVHKKRRPNTGCGTFWIPIVDWRTARIHLKNWSKELSPINYVTMISVPNQHPVFVGVDWVVRWSTHTPPKQLPFVPLCNIEQRILATLKPLTWKLPEVFRHVGQGYHIFGPQAAGTPLAEYPEMVLGADLPRHCIKWTKDIRLLTQGDKREKLRRRADQKIAL